MPDVRTTEIADGTYQLTTYLEEIDFGLNQYLVVGDEPLLFHTGLRSLYAPIAAAVTRIVPFTDLRWVGFGHVEADECGSLNQWLAAAPDAIAVSGCDRLHGVGVGHGRPAAPRALRTTTSSTSVDTVCVGSTHRISHTTGRPDSSATRPPGPSSVATCSVSGGRTRRPRPTTSRYRAPPTTPPTHSPRPARRSCDGSPASMSRPSPRCTAPLTPATAAPRSGRSPASSSSGTVPIARGSVRRA